MREFLKEALARAARRAVSGTGVGLVLAGDDVTIAVGVALVLVEYGIDTWREKRRARKAREAAQP